MPGYGYDEYDTDPYWTEDRRPMTVEQAKVEAKKCEQYTGCKAKAHELTCPNYNYP